MSQENLSKVKRSAGSNTQEPTDFSRIEARYSQQEQVEAVTEDEPVDVWVGLRFVKINAEVFMAAL